MTPTKLLVLACALAVAGCASSLPKPGADRPPFAEASWQPCRCPQCMACGATITKEWPNCPRCGFTNDPAIIARRHK